MTTLEDVKPEIESRTEPEKLVRRVRIEVREDSFGEDALFVTVVLGAPPEGAETWDLDLLQRLRGHIRDVLGPMDLPLTWYVEFEPEHPDIYDEEPGQ